ncbi:hypothetical protein B0O99DRAFT_595941 [Bisporella sp. PMI_857]|nr:hypothetical protein B0O99DRAFT_595941 [Bisporella sp. PMI_857]
MTSIRRYTAASRQVSAQLRQLHIQSQSISPPVLLSLYHAVPFSTSRPLLDSHSESKSSPTSSQPGSQPEQNTRGTVFGYLALLDGKIKARLQTKIVRMHFDRIEKMGISPERIEKSKYRTLVAARIATATALIGGLGLTAWLSWTTFAWATGQNKQLTVEEKQRVREEKWQKHHGKKVQELAWEKGREGELQIGRVY